MDPKDNNSTLENSLESIIELLSAYHCSLKLVKLFSHERLSLSKFNLFIKRTQFKDSLHIKSQAISQMLKYILSQLESKQSKQSKDSSSDSLIQHSVVNSEPNLNLFAILNIICSSLLIRNSMGVLNNACELFLLISRMSAFLIHSKGRNLYPMKHIERNLCAVNKVLDVKTRKMIYSSIRVCYRLGSVINRI